MPQCLEIYLEVPPAVAHSAVPVPRPIGYIPQRRCASRARTAQMEKWPCSTPNPSPFSADIEMVAEGLNLIIRSKKGRISRRDMRRFWKLPLLHCR